MKRIKNKGFAITSFLYSIFLLIVIFLILILLVIGNSSINYFKFQKQIKEKLDEITYSTGGINNYAMITFENKNPIIERGQDFNFLEGVQFIKYDGVKIKNAITYTTTPVFDNNKIGKYVVTYQGIVDGKIITKNRVITVKEETFKQTGVFITDVSIINSINADINSSNKVDIKQTTLSSSINLSETNINSSLTYKVTVYNSTSAAYYFSSVNSSEKYSNQSIGFKVDGLNEGDILNSKEFVTFTITFYYNSSTIVDNNLEFQLDFQYEIPIYTYDYTGDYEKFIVPYDGIYQIELWGAQGGGVYGGYGGYTAGHIQLNKNDVLFVYVGEHQDRGDFDVVYNGGGAALPESSHEASINRYTTGGGATDIRLVKGQWNNFDGLKSRIMVAGSGGGSNDASKIRGGAGGGLTGYNGILSGEDSTFIMSVATGGTQISGGIGGTSTYGSATFDGNGTPGGFGFGGDGITLYKSGGGSGYYGGGSSSVSRSVAGSGGGGSSFISGHNGCDAIDKSSTESSIIHTNQSVHYSGYQFTETVMIDGNGYNWTTKKEEYIGMPSHADSKTITGNTGHGYAKITCLKEIK